jgi:hypothetical protein
MQSSRATRYQQRLESLRQLKMSEDLQANFEALQAEHLQATQDISDLRALVAAATAAAAEATARATAATEAAAAATATSTTASSTTKFSANPFNSDINPTTSNGLKLYQAATSIRSDDSKVTATIAKSKEFLDAMRDDSAKFGWGTLIANIGPNKKHILHDFKDLTLNIVRTTMNPIFFDRTSTDLPPSSKPNMFTIDPINSQDDKAIFFKRVRANMIGQRLYNSLDSTSLASLKSKENFYLWKSDDGEEFYDGVTMLQILVEKVKPSTRVGIIALKDKIRACRLANFNHNVSDMLDHMNDTYLEIVRSGGKHDDMIMDLFTSLLSSKNEIFNSYIQRSKDNWEVGQDYEVDEIITSAVEKYNNMSEQKLWDAPSSSSAKIVALTTQVKDLERKLKSTDSSNQPKDASKPRQFLEVAEWRKTKSFGDSVFKDDKQWHWCSIKHNNGKGMYVTHKEEDHGKFRRGTPTVSNDNASKQVDNSSKKSTNKSMTLSDNLKAAMVSKFKCSCEDADKLWSEVAKNAENF